MGENAADNVEGDEKELLLPLLTIEDVTERLEPFIARNAGSKLNTVDVDDQTKYHRVEGPWTDPTLSIMLPDEMDDVAEALNNVYLPERLSALWHQDTKDVEVIWTAFSLSEDQKHVAGRKFTFEFNRKKYVCEFGDSSNRLKVLAKFCIPTSNPSPTNFRNLQSFIRMARREMFGDKAEYNPRSFWIRKVKLSEKHLIRMIECLNFYMSYYDSKSPRVLIHDVHELVSPKTRYVEGAFPSRIMGRALDENLASFWDATRQPNAMLKFIFYYRIIEYTSSHYVDASVRAKLAKILKNPTLGIDMDRSIDSVLSAFDGAGAQEVPRFNNLITNSVRPQIVWAEIEGNRSLFGEDVKFDGGYSLPSIIGKDETLKTFSAGGLIKFAHAIRSIRNVLVHGRDQNTATAITPTPRNMKYLSAWVNAIAAAAGEVVLYGTNT